MTNKDNFFDKRSKLLFILSIIEIFLSIWFLMYFNHVDRLNYSSIDVSTQAGLALLIKNMYTSTWWGLLIIVFCFIAIFSLIAFIYRDDKFQLISFILWFILVILSFNGTDTVMNNLCNLFIFVPVMLISFVAYKKQKAFSK